MKHAVIVLLHNDLKVLNYLFEFFEIDFNYYAYIDKHFNCNLDNIRITDLDDYIFSK